jgi:hypothetical protein
MRVGTLRTYSRMLPRVTVVRTDVSEEVNVSFLRVTKIGELGTTIDVTSNRRKLRRKTNFFSLVVSSQRASVAS